VALLEGLSPNTMCNAVMEYLGMGYDDRKNEPRQRFAYYASGGIFADKIERVAKSAYTSYKNLFKYSKSTVEGPASKFIRHSIYGIYSSMLLGILYSKLHLLGSIFRNINTFSEGVTSIINTKLKKWSVEVDGLIKRNAREAESAGFNSPSDNTVYDNIWSRLKNPQLRAVSYGLPLTSYLVNAVDYTVYTSHSISKILVPISFVLIKTMSSFILLEWIQSLGHLVYGIYHNDPLLFSGTSTSWLYTIGDFVVTGAIEKLFEEYTNVWGFATFFYGQSIFVLMMSIRTLNSIFRDSTVADILESIVPDSVTESLSKVSGSISRITPEVIKNLIGSEFRVKDAISLDCIKIVISLFHNVNTIANAGTKYVFERILSSAIAPGVSSTTQWPSTKDYINREYGRMVITGQPNESDEYKNFLRHPATKIFTALGLTISSGLLYWFLLNQSSSGSYMDGVNNQFLSALERAMTINGYNEMVSQKVIYLSNYISDYGSYIPNLLAERCNTLTQSHFQVTPPSTFELENIVNALLEFFGPMANVTQSLRIIPQ
jgi:hypothetical protein